VAHRGEFLQGRSADPHGRGGGADQLRELFLDLQQLSKQPVIGRVGDLRPVVDVVEGVMMMNFGAELPVAGGGLFLVHGSSF
jgi:hypothetical protein